jgi:isopentenyl phosphate kinase
MLVFLKLGGSLITDKEKPYTARPEKLAAITARIAAARDANPNLRLVLGHGSGSFGHAAASQHGTRRGVSGPEAWRGFAEVWYQAAALDRIVVDVLRAAGLPVLALAPIAAVTADMGTVASWDLGPLQAALENGLLPVVYGDVIFDQALGGTILSTEDLFGHLARSLRPRRILLAGREPGIWADFPARNILLPEITPESLNWYAGGLGEAAGADVTGGMVSKVSQMLELVKEIPGLDVLIFSGEDDENIARALRGENPGTLLHR